MAGMQVFELKQSNFTIHLKTAYPDEMQQNFNVFYIKPIKHCITLPDTENLHIPATKTLFY